MNSGFGFRGEALHSLRFLSERFSLFSSDGSSDLGLRKTFLNYGTEVKLEELPKRVCVLFKNFTPFNS